MSRMLKPVAAGLAISSLCLSSAADLSAQNKVQKKPPIKQVQAEEQPAVESGKRPRPAAESFRVPKLDPELEKVLADWELHTSRFQKLTGEFSRFKYDKTFEVEIRAVGKFAYEAPDKGNYELQGAAIEKDEVSKKLNPKKIPYRLMSDEAERWVCNGKKVVKINEKEKTFEEAPIPPDSQGQNIIDGPLPFLFGMKADRAKRRYRDLKLLKNTSDEIWLEVRSREEGDVRNWEKAVVIIDAKKFIPRAVKLKDATGAESVHVFRNVVVNPKRFFWEGDPFKPSLRSYKLIVTGKAPPPESGSKKSSAASAKIGAAAK